MLLFVTWTCFRGVVVAIAVVIALTAGVVGVRSLVAWGTSAFLGYTAHRPSSLVLFLSCLRGGCSVMCVFVLLCVLLCVLMRVLMCNVRLYFDVCFSRTPFSLVRV